ncbi:MAG: group II intron reverse transcriptase/maturase [Pseudomonadota bacterium]
MLSTPKHIRTLQRKLYLKAKQEPAYRFYALYDKLYRADILNHAYRLVRSNKGAAGIDGVTFSDIEDAEGVDVFLAELAASLRNKTYDPSPVRRVMIPKADGSQRALGIPTIRDRVAQMAAKLVIEPIFEADFCETSYGFRPRKSAHDAIDDVALALYKGYTEVIDADLRKYFDTIPHAKLMVLVAERISDGSMLHLIRLWLKAPIMEQDEDGTKRTIGGGRRNRQGTPQGGVISPLLANIYLHLVDRIWQHRGLQWRIGARIIRYADDIVILCRKGTRGPRTALEGLLERMDLQLNASKTRVVDARREMFSFLGFEIGLRVSRISGKTYPHVEPSKASVQAVKRRITGMTSRSRTMVDMGVLIKEVNHTVRGWVGYFHFRNCSHRLCHVRTHLEERMRTHLRKRHKIRDRNSGYMRFPRRELYKRYGLFKVPATAGWTKAHALR